MAMKVVYTKKSELIDGIAIDGLEGMIVFLE